MESLYQDETPERRAVLLADNCDRTETMEMKIPFSAEEKQAMKTDLADNLTQILTEDEKLQKAKDLHKEFVKPKKEVVKDLTKKLRNGWIKEEQTVYLMANQESGRMEIYDVNGDPISSRKLLPSEKQLSIRNINKTA